MSAALFHGKPRQQSTQRSSAYVHAHDAFSDTKHERQLAIERSRAKLRRENTYIKTAHNEFQFPSTEATPTQQRGSARNLSRTSRIDKFAPQVIHTNTIAQCSVLAQPIA
jgi:hypothetical protein